jgi:hypothetical protein
VAGMAREAGRFVVLDNVSSRWRISSYEVGDTEPVSSIDLGSTAVPVSRSADENVVSFLDWDDDLSAGVSRLDPAGWRAETCAALHGVDFTAEERAAFPAVPDGPVCGAADGTP